MTPGTSPGAAWLRTPALLQAAAETETVYGGRVRAWAAVATLWLDLSAVAGRETASQDQRPVRLESATATARDDPRAAVGQRLVVGADPPWTILAIDHAQPSPGLMRLTLERPT